ncbi:hypothetical protein ABVT39_009801 [Epinephelus coioides]
MADGAARGAAGVSKTQIKPDIYRTDTGKIIAEDELLNFLAVKMKTLSQDDVIAVAVDDFGSEWIVNSTKVLFELCPSTTRKLIADTGAQKDKKNIKSCLKLLNEVGEDAPRFVSHFLDELPPVTFNSLDVSCPLGKMEHLGADVHAMKQASEETRSSVEVQTSEEDSRRRVESSASSLDVPSSAATGALHTKWSDTTNSPTWSHVVKVGHRLKHVTGDTMARHKPLLNPPREKKHCWN